MKKYAPTLSALALVVCAVVTDANAQSKPAESLEQSYARLCGNGEKSETCDALRAALLKKLSGAASSTATSNTTAVNASNAAAAAQWGFWSGLAGKTWLTENGLLYSYAWQKPGEVLIGEIITPQETRTTRFTLSPDGSSIELQLPNAKYSLQPQSDGSFVQQYADTLRTRYVFSGSQMTLTREALTQRGWETRQTAETRRQLQANEIASHKSALAQKQQEVAAMIARDWGIVPKLIGRKFLDVTGKDDLVGNVYWIDRGTTAVMDFRAPGKRGGWLALTRNSNTGRIEAQTAAGWHGDVTMAPDGPLVVVWRVQKEWGKPTFAYSINGADLQLATYYTNNKGQRSSDPAIHRMVDVTGKSAEAVRVASAEQRRAVAQQTAEKKKSGGGFLRGAIGAAVGLAAAQAAGASADQTIGAMAKGVEMLNPESEAAARLGAAGDIMMQGSGTGAAGATSNGAAARPSYPTKPNLAVGAFCPGFTMANYRAKGLDRNGDVQLNTMCAQAFEYYSNYLNAIRQGYSEADANRTYEAHEGSTRVARHYYENNR